MRPWHRLPRLAAAALATVALLTGCSGDDADGGGDADGASSSGDRASTSATSEPATSEPGGTGASSPTATLPSSSATSGPAPTPSGVATGALVEGFPADVVQVLAGATITVSTVVPVNGARTVSLSGTTDLPAEEVLAFYRTSLVGQGFVESAGGQAAGFPSATFSRAGGADLLVVAVSTVEGVQTFTVGGTLAG